jgi:hypothetical protein
MLGTWGFDLVHASLLHPRMGNSSYTGQSVSDDLPSFGRTFSYSSAISKKPVKSISAAEVSYYQLGTLVNEVNAPVATPASAFPVTDPTSSCAPQQVLASY